ncbi:MAG: hypothetical protein ABI321_15960 [Polyangia bacterium]
MATSTKDDVQADVDVAGTMNVSEKPAKATTSEATCERCKQVPRGCALRRGMCRACYLRAWRGTELPADASCCACSEQRRVVLRWTQLGGDRLVTCQNCGFLADKTRPRVTTREELVLRLERERRRNERRRNYVVEPEDPAERRALSRRIVPRQTAISA